MFYDSISSCIFNAFPHLVSLLAQAQRHEALARLRSRRWNHEEGGAGHDSSAQRGGLQPLRQGEILRNLEKNNNF